LASGVSCCLGVRLATAQETKAAEKHTPNAVEDQVAAEKDPQNGTTAEEKPDGRGAFVIAPLPISSPALGAGIVPVFAYIFPLGGVDDHSPASVIGAAGLVTNNGSRALALGGQLYFKENTYHTTVTYLRGNLNYDLYGLGNGDSQARLPLKQEGDAVLGEFLRRTAWKFFVGPRFIWGSSLISIRGDNADNAPVPPDVGLRTTLTALGFRINRDTRPNRFYPTDGMLIDFTSDFFSQGLGSKYSFQSYKFTFNKYFGFGDRQVLAYNFFACGTGGQPPFYGNCIYGTNNELRGYVAGRYLDRYMVATQIEYRLSLPMRFGLVAFGGVGEVIPGGNQSFRAKSFLPSAGAGGRFQLSKKYHVNLRVDYAQGTDTHTWSVGVGEAF
jgi:outer membrane protein assembly factor BamA